jgi:hypothetical protein
MYDDTPQPPTMGGNLGTNQSMSMSTFMELTTTSSVNHSEVLLEVLDKAHYQLGTALDHMEVLTEVIHWLEKQISISLGLMKPWPSASMLWNRDLTASLKM